VFRLKLMKTVKRIAALSTGAVMVGATVLSASAAADLANYPAPFVQNGKFNAVIVVGNAANAADVLGSVDIATSLQVASRVERSVSAQASGSVSVSGEAWRVGTSSKKFEMSEALSAGSPSAHQETVRNITTFITKDELPTILADDTFRNDKGDFDYHQYLYFDNVNPQTGTNDASMTVVYSEDPDTDETAQYFFVKNGHRVARYSLEFTSSAESDITDSAGSASTTGTYIWNFEGKNINMLGKEFSIVKARRTTANGNAAELTLMGGATRDILSEGETKTYTVKGKDYEVNLNFVGSTTAKFIVNGELTDSLQEGSTATLADSSQVGVKDILAQDFAGGVRRVEFFLGADKVFLKDTDINKVGSGSQTLEVGNEKIDDTKVTITGSDDNTTFKIDTIELNISADDDFFVPAGGMITQQMEEPQALLNSWDIKFEGLEAVPTEMIRIKTSGSNQYELEFVDGDGNKASVPLAYTSGGTALKLGDNDDDLILTENDTHSNISRNDYFIVSDGSQKQGERKSYVLRYKGASKITDSSPVIKFQNVGSGETLERPLSSGSTTAFTGTAIAVIQLGGASYNVFNLSGATTDDFNIIVDLDADGSQDAYSLEGGRSNVMNVTTKAGGQVLFMTSPANATLLNNSGGALVGLTVSIQTVDSDDYDNVAPSPVEFNITAASGKVQLTEVTTVADLNYKSPEGETNTNYAYTNMGAYIKWDNPTNDPDTLDIEYPTVQRLPLVYIGAPDLEVSTGEASEGGKITYFETQPIAVGSAKLAGEVTNLNAQNAIVIGGPCANDAAAELMGNPANCAEGFSSGKAVLKLYEHANGKVALLVAGGDAMDTRRASRVVANYEQWQDSGKLKGMEVEVVGTSFTDISVAAPAPKPAPAPVAPVDPVAPVEPVAPTQ
jgi:hypothetical protein